MSENFDSQKFLASLTHQPGVYRMYDANQEVIYVGKAKSLKKRVSSYFRKQVDSVKTQALVKNICAMDVTVTNTESEALILENSFIKKYRPKYNVLLRDDKSYPYIFVSAHQHPRIAFHRGARREKGDYFGPFPNGHAVRESLKLIQKIFPVRQCDDSYYRARSRPCLQHQLKRCLAPCVNICTDDEYQEQVNLARMFLRGKNQEVIDELVKSMEGASEELNFEKAASLRDQIIALRAVQEKNAVSGGQSELDVIGVWRESGTTCIHLLFIRGNGVQGSRSYFPKVPANTPLDEVLESFVLQFYLNQQQGRTAPSEVVIDLPKENAKALSQQLSEALQQKVVFSTQSRGDRAQYAALANKNAMNAVQSKLGEASVMQTRVEALQKLVGDKADVQRMECFDISHTMGEETVASCVVFNREGPAKSDYRRYNIKDITPGDDYAAMLQVLTRRYRNAIEQENVPDIVFIDGGKGQLTQAETYFEEWPKPPLLIGIAKGESRKPGLETLIFGFSRETHHLPADHPALHLIQYIRDESHRFAITGHRQRRAKVKKTSRLEEIPAVGPKRRQNLLKYLGGIQQVKNASIEQLAKVPGISRELAETIYYALRDE
ncbi:MULTISPECIES: excinuclease ABC subunit UvrC [Gammaproteobacteria]|uniref:excinuclease ABC subunit UvrC n=1 Tax=Gammaproteobacteria TaxID=1236 RepID=UPI000DD09696|nr:MULTISPECIES: excinuclease ABC subunit UvrC [Gammaproteobacteria]RTE87190.1 excinuclease ABC subunit UvrC [Aliidiomarina sp. B3213]TCZ93022.1 excinuclease ABC subunit UvrC [Lysobacter sp. N42]